MVKFRFSIILLCVIMPPLLYITTLQLLEHYTAGHVQDALEESYLGNTLDLLSGAQSIRAAIHQNVDTYLRQNRWIDWGAKAMVTVRTGGNTLLYPLSDMHSSEIGGQPMEIASDNYHLLNEVPEITLVFRLPHNSRIANSVLALYILSSLTLLLIYYRNWKHRYHRQLSRQLKAQNQLKRKSELTEQQLKTLKDERRRLKDEADQLQTNLAELKQLTDSSEDEMLEEMISLEEQISNKKEKQQEQQIHIAALQAKIEQLEIKLQKESGFKKKSTDPSRKRLVTLYKNINFEDRALDGYLGLAEGLKIKCEEVIHNLNANPALVPIKRKVFGKKNRQTVFEVVFGYKGRLYYRPIGNNKMELLTIGTKNSQQQDLDYLNRI